MPDNQVQSGPEAMSTVLPSENSASPVQGGQDAQYIPVEADLQALDPVIEHTVDIQATNSDSEASGNLRAADLVTNDLQVAASVLQGSAAVGLQLAASVSTGVFSLPLSLVQATVANNNAGMQFGVLRPYPDTSTLWAEYFMALPKNLPRMNLLLAGFKTPFHPSASYSDYLARIISGDRRGGPILGEGMHQMALNGVAHLTNEEILNRLIHLDLTVRFFRLSHVTMKAARARETVAAKEKADELQAEIEMYKSSKGVYLGEIERLEGERARFRHDLELFAGARAKFDHLLLRFGAALNLGTTIEELQMNHDRLVEHLKAILESTLVDSAANLELLAQMRLSGGTAQWLHRSLDLMRRSVELTNTVSGNQARLVAQENRHRAAMDRLEEENHNLRFQVEYLTSQQFRESLEEITDESSS